MDVIDSLESLEVGLGQQIKQLRIRLNLSQEELSGKANVSISALKNLEGGKGSSLTTLMLVVRALNRSDWFKQLCPTPTVSPMARVTLGRDRPARSRVSRRVKEGGDV